MERLVIFHHYNLHLLYRKNNLQRLEKLLKSYYLLEKEVPYYYLQLVVVEEDFIPPIVDSLVDLVVVVPIPMDHQRVLLVLQFLELGETLVVLVIMVVLVEVEVPEILVNRALPLVPVLVEMETDHFVCAPGLVGVNGAVTAACRPTV